jgi:hypothetical protein
MEASGAGPTAASDTEVEAAGPGSAAWGGEVGNTARSLGCEGSKETSKVGELAGGLTPEPGAGGSGTGTMSGAVLGTRTRL